MRFQLEQRFPAPLEAVEAALLDPTFVGRLAQFPKLGAPELLEHEVDGDVVRQHIRYRFTGALSPAVTSVVDQARLTWVEETTFDRRTHRGHHSIVPDHYATRLSCGYTTRLEPAGAQADATLRVTEGDIRVRFPLVGGKVEKAIVGGLADHADQEIDVLVGWLAEQG